MNKVDPGKGYRLLLKGEPIPDDVTYYAKGKWEKMTTDTNVGVLWNDVDFFPMRVPIEPIDNTGIEVTTSGPYVAIEVHRAALAEIERLKAELDAVKQPQWKRGIPSEEEFAECWLIYGGCGDVPSSKSCEVYGPKESDEAWWEDDDFYIALRIEPVKQSQPDPGPEPEWFDLTPFGEHVLRAITDQGHSCISVGWVDPYWPPVTTTVKIAKSWGWEQFRCLLKDAPPELVAMASKPAEDPDEWVTQDRVPYRKELDQCKWDNFEEWLSFQDVYPSYRHGFRGVSGQTLQVRCRRRDLPPMPKKPKTETECEVSLYWYDGNVVGRYADCPPTDPSFVPLIVRDGKVFIETETREVVR